MPDVLVVDSEIKGAERLRDMLENAGAKVKVCHSGAEAFSALQAQEYVCSAAYLSWDVQGPPFGPELITRLRNRWTELPIVILSGDCGADTFIRASQLGAKEWLRKPFSPEEFAAVWQRLIAEPPPDSDLLSQLRERVRGEAHNLIALLRDVEQIILKNKGNVLLLGETGTGKTELAKAIHELSQRKNTGAYKKINLRERPASLVEADLFGIEEKTFTGVKKRIGILEAAGAGTVFLDEIGEVTDELKVKLLQVVEDGEFVRLGSTVSVPFHARLIFATNQDLHTETGRRKFRQDLFYRVAGTTLHLPALRERKGDIPILLDHFLAHYRQEREMKFAALTRHILCDYRYPGNVRELMLLVENAVTKCTGDKILPQHLNTQIMQGMPMPATPEKSIEWLITGLVEALPENWAESKRADSLTSLVGALTRAFDRAYLPLLRNKYRYRKDAAQAAGIDLKTFNTKWEEAGLSEQNHHQENEEERTNEPGLSSE